MDFTIGKSYQEGYPGRMHTRKASTEPAPTDLGHPTKSETGMNLAHATIQPNTPPGHNDAENNK
ncbi:hypothetical protein BKM88_03650 [Anaplasma marginale]|nr:hypothetical protein CQZ76_03660 [Anaplasma marginale]AXW85179.1 hypothetical protein BKM88_03650 [Anaplasma marginale]KAB0451879.1 hypothetical protein FY192_03880 [Anaplasma marginale]TZF78883.1 hypothetical protein FY180_02145 [Anaplasma marginale]